MWHFCLCGIISSVVAPNLATERGCTRGNYYILFGFRYGSFGVDYPMWDYGKELERFFALELSDSENRAILSENLEVFLGESYS